MFSPNNTTPISLPLRIIHPSPPHRHTHTVIFLHGRGDNVDNFVRALHRWRDSSGRSLFDAFPSVRWVFPQAPLRPVAASGGAQHWPQWFDVWNTRDFADREELQLEGLREMVPAVRELMRREVEGAGGGGGEGGGLGGDWGRLVLAGISMGGATGVHTLFNLALPEGRRLGGFMGFCARCPFAGRGLREMREVLGLGEGVPEGDDNGVLRTTPVLLEHCVDDPLVRVEWGRGLRDTLRGFGAQVEWREYPTGGHWFHEPEGLDDVLRFLGRVFADGGN